VKQFLTLFKFQFRSQYGISLLKSSLFSEQKKPLKVIGLALIILVAFSEMIGLYTFVMWKVFETAKTLEIPEITLTFGALLAGAFILIFGTFYILSGIFFAKDTEFLSVLPVKQQIVFASKFVLVMIGEYPFVLAMLAPPVLIYGIFMNCGPLFYLGAILCGLILPIIPLAIAAFFSLLLMKLISKLKRRDLFVSIVGIVAFVGIFLANNLLISKFTSTGEGAIADRILDTIRGLVDTVGRAFPPSIWFTRILTANPFEVFLNSLYLVGASAVALIVVLFLASFIYQKGAQSQLESAKTTSKKKLRYETSSPVLAVFITEFRMILRTPIYALNSFAGWVMGPLVILMPTFSGAFKDPELKAMIETVQGSNKALSFLVITGLLVFFSLVNPAPSSSISREGSGFWLLRSSPILPRTYVLGKLLSGSLISIGAILIAGVTLLVVSGLDVSIILVSIGCALLISYPVATAGILIDVIRPKLVWTNPQEVIKQNLNVVFAMLAGLLIAGVLGLAGYLMINADLNYYLIVSVIILLTLFIGIALQTILFRLADRKFG